MMIKLNILLGIQNYYYYYYFPYALFRGECGCYWNCPFFFYLLSFSFSFAWAIGHLSVGDYC